MGKDGKWDPFAPPVKNPVFGVVNLGDDKVYRWYPQWKAGERRLELAMVQGVGLRGAASQAATMAGETPATPLAGEITGGTPVPLPDPFLLHYYGPHKRANGQQTFRYVPAYAVLSAQIDGEKGEKAGGISPEMFKGKIVILCAIAQGTFDLKTSPLSDEYPGPEVQATAMENLLRGERVHVVGLPVLAGVAVELCGGGERGGGVATAGECEGDCAGGDDGGVADHGGAAVSDGGDLVDVAGERIVGDRGSDAGGICVDLFCGRPAAAVHAQGAFKSGFAGGGGATGAGAAAAGAGGGADADYFAVY